MERLLSSSSVASQKSQREIFRTAWMTRMSLKRTGFIALGIQIGGFATCQGDFIHKDFHPPTFHSRERRKEAAGEMELGLKMEKQENHQKVNFVQAFPGY